MQPSLSFPPRDPRTLGAEAGRVNGLLRRNGRRLPGRRRRDRRRNRWEHGRALLLLSGACAINCRYCFRREFPYQGAWFAMMAPQGTDEVVLGRIAAAVKDILNDPEYRASFLIPQGYEAVGNTPAEFAANLRVDTLAGAMLSKLVPAKAPN